MPPRRTRNNPPIPTPEDLAPEPILSTLEYDEILELFKEWFVPQVIRSLVSRQLIEVVRTHLLTLGVVLRDNEILQLPVQDLRDYNPPDWVISCRQNGITENEIQTIIHSLGRDRESILSVNSEDFNSLALPVGSLRKFRVVLQELGHHLTPPDENHPRGNITEGGNMFSQGTDINVIKHLVDTLKPDPNIPTFISGEDKISYVNRIRQRLANEKCDDETRLRCLKKGLADELLTIAKKIPQEINEYHEYIEALLNSLHTPQARYKADFDLRELRYHSSEIPERFIENLRKLLKRSLGRPVDDGLVLHHVMDHLPKFIQDEIYFLSVNDDLKKIENVLTRHHFEYNRNRNRPVGKNTSSSSTVATKFIKKEKSLPTNVTITKETGNVEVKKSFCRYCKRSGHDIEECEKLKIKNSEKEKLAHKEVNVPKGDKALTYDEEDHDNEIEQEEEEAESPVGGLRDSDYVYAINDEPKMITKLGSTKLQWMPQMTLKLCTPDRVLINEGQVLVDTGATTSAMDRKLAETLKVHMIPCKKDLHGIVAGASVKIAGFAYAMVKHPEMKEPRIFKLQITENFYPKCLLSNVIIHLYYGSIISDGTDYTIKLHEKPGSDPKNPLLYFRYTTPEETKSILETAKHVNGDEIGNNYIIDNLTKKSQPSRCSESDVYAFRKLNGKNNPPNEITAVCTIQSNELQRIVKEPFLEKIYSRIDPVLKESYKIKLLQLIHSFRDVFAHHKNDLGFVPSTVCPVTIDIEGNTVPYSKPYSCAIKRREIFRDLIKDMIQHDIIEPSNAEGGAPSLLVPRADGSSYRMVIDYRALNRLTKVPRYPMPRIDDCLEVVRGGLFFNLFDLAQGYHQIELSPKEREKTVFVTPDGKYQYKRLPMGLSAAPFIFQKFMNKVLDGLQYKNCIGYFDDVPVIGKTFEELIENTKQVLERFRQFNLKIRPDKCHLGYPEILLLGHMVSGEGIRADPKKIEALKRLPYPKNVRELQSQLGCYNYFSRYIPDFAKIAAPLYRLVSKERRFKIMPEDKRALDILKETLVKITMLVHYNPELRRKISADASDYAVGGILQQEDGKSERNESGSSIEMVKDWLPIAYYSQKLHKHQLSYTISEKELLAILVGIHKYHHYLEGEEFLIETDHHALCQINKVQFKNSRLQRWTILLSTYQFKVVHKSGATHASDCFSRNPTEWEHRKCFDPEEEFLDRIYLVDYVYNPEDCYFHDIGLNAVNFCLESSLSYHQPNEAIKDPPMFMFSTFTVKQQFHSILSNFSTKQQDFSLWKEKVQKCQKDSSGIINIRELLSNKDSIAQKRYYIKDDLLYRKDRNTPFGGRLVIDLNILKEIFKFDHESPLGGHFGVQKTYLQIAKRFWCKHLYDEVKKLCDSCHTCQHTKPANIIYVDPAAKPIPEKFFERLELDVQGPISIKKVNKYIIVLVDVLTRHVYAKLTNNQTAATIISFLTTLFNSNGYPIVIQTDQGTNFTSDAVKLFLRENGIKHEKSNPYHPQSQGIVERCNRTIAERLRSYVYEKGTSHLKEALEASLFAINTSVHKITQFTPYFLVFGQEPRKPLDNHLELEQITTFNVHQARKLAFARLHAQQLYQINKTKQHHQSSPYKLGDFVFVKNEYVDAELSKKLRPKFRGPYLVCGIQKGSLLLLDTDDLGIFSYNVSNTKLYRGELTDHMKRLRDKYFVDDTFVENEDFDTEAIKKLADGHLELSINNEKDKENENKSEKINGENEISPEGPEQPDNLKLIITKQPLTLNNHLLPINKKLTNNLNAFVHEEEDIARQCINNSNYLKQTFNKSRRRKYVTADKEIVQQIKDLNIDPNETKIMTRAKSQVKQNQYNYILYCCFISDDIDSSLKLNGYLKQSLNFDASYAKSEKPLKVKYIQKTKGGNTNQKKFSLKRVNANHCHSRLYCGPLNIKSYFDLFNYPFILEEFSFIAVLKIYTKFPSGKSIHLNFQSFSASVNSSSIINFPNQSKSFLCFYKPSEFKLLKMDPQCKSVFKPVTTIDEVTPTGEVFACLSPTPEAEQQPSKKEKDRKKLFESCISGETEDSDSEKEMKVAIVHSRCQYLNSKINQAQYTVNPSSTTSGVIPTNSGVSVASPKTLNIPEEFNAPLKRAIPSSPQTNSNSTPSQKKKDNSSQEGCQWVPTSSLQKSRISLRKGNSSQYFSNTEKYLQTHSNHGNPPRYLKPNDYQFKQNEYPAPLPTAKLPSYTSKEKFFEVREMVKQKKQTFSELKVKFEMMIREKIYENVYHDESIFKISLPSIPRGVSRSQVICKNLFELENDFRCYFCEQIAMDPCQCVTCNKWYCLNCAKWLRNLINILNLTASTYINQFICLLDTCINEHILIDSYPSFKEIRPCKVYEQYLESRFICRYTFCTRSFPPYQLLKHEQHCRVGLFREEIDFSFKGNFKRGEIRENLEKAVPKRLMNFLPPHLKCVPKPLIRYETHQNSWNKKMELWACLIENRDENPQDPNLGPCAIRSHTDLRFGWWTNKARAKDPTAPLEEGEEYLQDIGFEPTVGSRPDPGTITRPRTINWSRVPLYLILDSEEWLKVAKGCPQVQGPDYAVPVAEGASEPELPFIRIYPLNRLNPSEQQYVRDNIKIMFPNFSKLEDFSTPAQKITSRKAEEKIQRRNASAYHFQRLTYSRVPSLKPKFVTTIKNMITQHPDPNNTYAINMAFCRIQCVRSKGNLGLHPFPIWIVIVDGHGEVVYETFISYNNCDELGTEFHGLTARDIKNAKTFKVVKEQVLVFLTCAKYLVGAGLINMFQALDLDESEIQRLRSKLREVTQFYSPYRHNPASLPLISFLLFHGFTIQNGPHSPRIEAVTAMKLYMAYWPLIEQRCYALNDGIHQFNVNITCGNSRVARLLRIYSNKVENGEAEWPIYWSHLSHPNRNIPVFDKHQCITPSSSGTSTPIDSSPPEPLYQRSEPLISVEVQWEIGSKQEQEENKISERSEIPPPPVEIVAVDKEIHQNINKKVQNSQSEEIDDNINSQNSRFSEPTISNPISSQASQISRETDISLASTIPVELRDQVQDLLDSPLSIESENAPESNSEVIDLSSQESVNEIPSSQVRPDAFYPLNLESNSQESPTRRIPGRISSANLMRVLGQVRRQ